MITLSAGGICTISDTYIEKDSSINDEIDKLRHWQTSALLERNDVIVVASVSVSLVLGSPKEYLEQVVSFAVSGTGNDRNQLLRNLIDIQFAAKRYRFSTWTLSVRGDVGGNIPRITQTSAPLRWKFLER